MSPTTPLPSAHGCHWLELSQSASHSWPVASHLCPVYWSCTGPNYKQVHFMVVIFVVNYVSSYLTVTVDNEYRWNARKPGPMTARNYIVSLRTSACSDCVECTVMPSRTSCDNYVQQNIGKYRPHRIVESLADLYQISLLNKWHFAFRMYLFRFSVQRRVVLT
jgi:hypothetical protein